MKWLTVLFLCISFPLLAAQDPVSLMALWDYGDPAATREKFRERLPEVNRSGDRNYLVALLSQIARTYSLQGEFRTAHAELDAILPLVDDRQASGYVLYLLERGRTFNSAGEREEAARIFQEAFDLAREIGHDYLTVDAAHMLGIALPLDEQMAWNRRALEIAEASESEAARDWLGTLYNNMGWTYFDQGEYEPALALFRKGVEFRREQGQARRLQIARWAVGRTLRALGREGEALDIQLALEAENEEKGLPADGYVLEELGELHLSRDPEKARQYFGQAWEILSRDAWLKENQPDRLARIRKLSKFKENERDQ